MRRLGKVVTSMVWPLIALAPDLSVLNEATQYRRRHRAKEYQIAGASENSTRSSPLTAKGFRPDGKSAAVLIPPAFGLAGVNLGTLTRTSAQRPTECMVQMLRCTQRVASEGGHLHDGVQDAGRFFAIAQQTDDASVSDSRRSTICDALSTSLFRTSTARLI